jgi:hypothetical protein
MAWSKIIYLIKQKFLPNSKKDFIAEIRLKNGFRLVKPIPNHVSSFKLKKDNIPYYLEGKPDTDDFTGQKLYTYIEGCSYPIKFDAEQEHVIQVAKNFGNSEDELILADDNGYKRGMLLAKSGMDFAKWTFIVAVINLVVTGIGMVMIMRNLGIIGGA